MPKPIAPSPMKPTFLSCRMSVTPSVMDGRAIPANRDYQITATP
jgi:hypothetical protein